MLFYRILIQQLYLQVCNIGKNLKDEMSRSQASNHLHPQQGSSFLQTIESHLEIFTKKQTIIIEKWSKAEARSRELQKQADNAAKLQDELAEILEETEKLKNQLTLFDPSLTCVQSNQEQIIERKVLTSKLEKLKKNVGDSQQLEKLTSVITDLQVTSNNFH